MKRQFIRGLSLAVLPLAGWAQQAPLPPGKVEYFNESFYRVATKAEAKTWVETIYQDSVRAVRLTYNASDKLTDSSAFSNERLKTRDGAQVAFRPTGEVFLREQYRAGTLLSRLAYYEGGKLRRRESYDAQGKRTSGKLFDQKGAEIPFCEYQVLPSWPGGVEMFVRQVAGRVKYPLRALRNREEGRVLIGFVVNKTGKVEGVHCLNPTEVPALLAEEAEEKVRAMPAEWQNGWLDCEPVSVSFTVPVTFKIQ